MIYFTIEGLIGHFRKYYTTVTSLTYAFPPRNTVAGIIAAILGMRRDSYYDIFSRKRAKLGLQILTPIRKVSFTTNYLDTDQLTLRRFRGEGMVPTRVEYVMGTNGSPLRYRIFFEHKDKNIIEKLKAKLRERKTCYPLSLGPANCLAHICEFGDEDVDIINATGDKEFNILTVIRQDNVVKIDPAKNVGKRIMIEERLPPDFKGGRQPASKSLNYIYEAECRPLRVFVKGEVYKINSDGYGTFM